MDSFNNLSKLREMLAKHPKEIERSLNPMAEIIEAVEQARRQWAGMIEAIEQARNQWYDFAQTLAMSIERTKQQFQGVFLAHKQSIENIERVKLEWTKWTELTRTVEKLNSFQMTEIYLANASWQSSITSIVESFRQSRLLESHPQLSNRLLEPYNCYSQFARKTLEQLGEEKIPPGEKNALTGSLVLAEKQVVSTADLLRESVVLPLDADASIATPIIDIFDVQQMELLNAGKIQVDQGYLILLKLSPTATLSHKARNVTKNMIVCNLNAKLSGDDEIFTPTTSLLDAQNNLSWIAVKDDLSLGNLIDCLYIMLYEAAGRKNLRYMKFVDDEACSIIWVIKDFRNKRFRHDPDHGRESNQRKSWHELSESLSKLGFTSFPRNKEDFQMVQRRLLDEVDTFLQKLANAIEQKGKK
jgi:hypothetical protein